MSILTTAIIGAIAGLIVSSWQGFKDPPWEGFVVRKFMRSILVGMIAGIFFNVASNAGALSIDNPGILAFSIVTVERVIGEAYKGFFRRRAHDEYSKLLHRIGVPQRIHFIKIMVGIGFIVGAYWLFHLLAWGLGRMMAGSDKLWQPGLLAGASGGLLVAIGGALKDSQFEGFKPAKFLRSPIVGALSGMLLIYFSKSRLLIVLASIGGERVGVELYKTFLKRQVRGIHANQPILFPHWFARRWVFALSFFLAAIFCIVLLMV